MATKIIADILENEKGEMLLAIPATEGTPEEPTLALGKDASTLIVNRNKTQQLEINEVNASVRDKLLNLKQVLVTEVGNDGVKEGYYATILK